MTAAFYDDPAYVYGTSARKYDEAPATYDANRLHWRFEVAWNHLFVYFSETNGQTEVIYSVDCYWNRGRKTFVNSDGSGLTRHSPGRMVITLINKDNRYDPLNSSSALFPNVVPGKFIRLGVRLASASTYTWRFTGFITNVRVTRKDNGESFVELECVDGWQFLQDRAVYLSDSAGVNASVHVANVLRDVEWPLMWGSTITAETVTMPYFWAGGKDARTVLFDIADTQLSRVWIAGDGSLHYKPRDSSDSLIASITQADLLKDIAMNNPWDNTWNFVRLISIAPADGYAASIWGDNLMNNLGDFAMSLPWISTELAEYTIPAGGTVTIEGQYLTPSNFPTNLNEEFFFSIMGDGIGAGGETLFELVDHWEHEFGSATAGGGNDISGLVQVLSFRNGGTAFQVKLKNNHSGIAYSRHMSVWTVFASKKKNSNIVFVAQNVSSGPQKQVTIKTPYMLSYTTFTASVLQTIASDYLSLITSIDLFPLISLQAKPSLQFLDVYDRYNLVSAKLSISQDYRVGYIEEKWLSPNAQAVETKIQAEPYVIF